MLCVLTGHVLRRDPPFCCGDMNLWVKSRSTITEHGHIKRKTLRGKKLVDHDKEADGGN